MLIVRGTGALQTSGILESACRTWEAALWETISVACQERVGESEVLVHRQLGGRSSAGNPLGELWVRRALLVLKGEAAEEEEEAWVHNPVVFYPHVSFIIYTNSRRALTVLTRHQNPHGFSDPRDP